MWRIAVDSVPTRHDVGSGLPSRARQARAHDHDVREGRPCPGENAVRSNRRPTGQVWTIVFVVLVLIIDHLAHAQMIYESHCARTTAQVRPPTTPASAPACLSVRIRVSASALRSPGTRIPLETMRRAWTVTGSSVICPSNGRDRRRRIAPRSTTPSACRSTSAVTGLPTETRLMGTGNALEMTSLSSDLGAGGPKGGYPPRSRFAPSWAGDTARDPSGGSGVHANALAAYEGHCARFFVQPNSRLSIASGIRLREARHRPDANWQVWTMVFVVLVLIMTIWLMLRGSAKPLRSDDSASSPVDAPSSD